MTPPQTLPVIDLRKVLPPPPDAVVGTVLHVVTAPLEAAAGIVGVLNNTVVGVVNKVRQLPREQ